MREARGQFTHGEKPLLPRHEDLHQMRLGDVGQQHDLAATGEFTARQVDETAIAQLRVLGGGASVRHRPIEHHREDLSEQRLAEQFERGGVHLENGAPGIEHQHAAGQAVEERRHARRESFVAGVRLAQVPLQFGHLAAQRIEGAGQLVGHRAESAAGRLQIGALIVDRVEI